MSNRASEEAQRVGIEFHERMAATSRPPQAPVQPVRPAPAAYHDLAWAGAMATQYPEAAKLKRAGSVATTDQFPMVSTSKLSMASRAATASSAPNTLELVPAGGKQSSSAPNEALLDAPVPSQRSAPAGPIDLSHPAVHALLQQLDPP